MGLGIAGVERALLALAPEQRAEVIRRALRSLESGQERTGRHTVTEEWSEELGRRAEDIVQGRVELGTFAATRAEFERRHPRSDE